MNNARPGLAAGELLAWHCAERQLDARSVLVCNHSNGSKAVLAPEMLRILQSCNQFQTIDDHLAAICQRNPRLKSNISSLLQAMQQVDSLGLTTRGSEVWRRLTAKVQPNEAPAEPLAVTVATCDRPAELERLLVSFAPYMHGAYFDRMVVVDSSRQAENRARNKQLIDQLAGQATVALHHFDAQRQVALLEKLIQARPELASEIRFLLDSREHPGLATYGLTKNLCQLLSVGRRQVLIDDDSILQLYAAPAAALPLQLFAGQREARFFSSDAQWQAYQCGSELDPFQQLHTDVGVGLATILGRLEGGRASPASLVGAAAAELEYIGAGASVMTTACGYYGDPGMGGINTWLLGLPDDSLQQFLASPASYSAGLLAENCWRGSAGNRIVPEFDMSCVAGLDNRRLLPPYFPVNRQEDRLFGKMLKLLYRDSLALDYPWAIPNLNPRPSRGQVTHLDVITEPSFPLFDSERLPRLSAGGANQIPCAGLAELGLYYEMLATIPDAVLGENYNDCLASHRVAMLGRIGELQVQFPAAPAHWKQLLDQAQKQFQQALADQVGVDSLRHTSVGLQGAALVTFFRQYWQGFGKALPAWPEIRALVAANPQWLEC